MLPTPQNKFPVSVHLVRREAEGIRSYELRHPNSGQLPAFTAGAHVDVVTPSGAVRSYSLCNDESERHRYVIGVQLDPHSRGGSRSLHEQVRPGDLIDISSPINNFRLNEEAPHSVLIAGGIGITPIMAMARRLDTIGADWELYYAVKAKARAAFLPELTRMTRLQLHIDEENNDTPLDIAGIIATVSQRSHVYCCGPVQMLESFEACTSRMKDRCHIEYFKAKKSLTASGNIEVELARSGRTIDVPEGVSILDAVVDAGIDVPFSCTEGICGSCRTGVLAGIPDHRDHVLTAGERDRNDAMMICCSRSKDGKLVLDL